MMQTLEISTLVQRPVASLWYLHINPPLFDLVRWVLVIPDYLLGNDITELLADRRLYMFHAVLFGLTSAFVYNTVRTLGSSRPVAIASAVVWTSYPGNVAMATYLDPTYLSAFLLLAAVNRGIHWSIRRRNQDAFWALTALLLLSWTRSLIQMQILIPIVLIAVVLYLKGRKNVVNTLKLLMVLTLLFLPIKQYALFGSFSTSTFVGGNQLGIIQYQPTADELNRVEVPRRMLANTERVVSKYNSPENAILNFRQEAIFRERLISHPIDSLKVIPNTVFKSGRKALTATQDYQPNAASEHLPWSAFGRWVFSGWRYLLLGGIGVVGLLVSRGWRDKTSIGILMSIVVIGSQVLLGSLRFGTSAFDWTESNRLKFIVEPVLFCIIGIGVATNVRRFRGDVMRRLRTGARGGN